MKAKKRRKVVVKITRQIKTLPNLPKAKPVAEDRDTYAVLARSMRPFGRNN